MFFNVAPRVMSYVLELRTCRDILVHVAANHLDYCARDDFVVAPYPRKRHTDRLLPSYFFTVKDFFFFLDLEKIPGE